MAGCGGFDFIRRWCCGVTAMTHDRNSTLIAHDGTPRSVIPAPPFAFWVLVPAARLGALWSVSIAFAALAGILSSDDTSEVRPQNAVSQRRRDLMQSVVNDISISDEAGGESGLKLGERPLLRYSDPTRGLLDAGVWRIGDASRPA